MSLREVGSSDVIRSEPSDSSNQSSLAEPSWPCAFSEVSVPEGLSPDEWTVPEDLGWTAVSDLMRGGACGA